LDALVVLKASGETLQLIKDVEPVLKDVCIVSKVEVVRSEGPYVESTEFNNLGIEIKKASGTKCARCWHYSEDVGANASHPLICGNCVSQIL
jgi:isoleucyl-tRNA synthetase